MYCYPGTVNDNCCEEKNISLWKQDVLWSQYVWRKCLVLDIGSKWYRCIPRVNTKMPLSAIKIAILIVCTLRYCRYCPQLDKFWVTRRQLRVRTEWLLCRFKKKLIYTLMEIVAIMNGKIHVFILLMVLKVFKRPKCMT